MSSGFLVISLDFELYWGVRDKRRLSDYKENLLGVRDAVPAMLRIFREYGARSTWAVVGFLLFGEKRELIEYLPASFPNYLKKSLNPYLSLDNIGESEKEDPYHYALSLVNLLREDGAVEIASHTFSHYYCLEEGQTLLDFASDLEAAVQSSRRLGIAPKSLVFPRNQYSDPYIEVAKKSGFIAFRGNEHSWMHSPQAGEETAYLKRCARLIDAYANLSGHHTFKPELHKSGMLNIPSSRFLRPYSSRLGKLEHVRIRRILNDMTAAAKSGRGYHLWWHPHNFGRNLNENIRNLEQILSHFRYLREKYGMEAKTMSEAASAA